jgi:hypothetical protein
MTMELPEREFEVLWDGGDCSPSPVRCSADRGSTLLVWASAAHATAATLARLEHAAAPLGVRSIVVIAAALGAFVALRTRRATVPQSGETSA